MQSRRAMGSRDLQGQQLLPGLPDELVLQNVVPRLPFYARARAETLSRSWRLMLLQREGFPQEQQRWRLALARHRGLLLRHGASCSLSFLDFSDRLSHPLPPLPFAHRGLGATFAFVFCANRRVFAAQRSAACSIKRVFMLDVAAGLFRWQQRFGPPSRLHRRHVGDARGSIQVRSPYQCTIVRFKVYVVAQRLPALLYSVDSSQALRYHIEPGNSVAAAVYDAWEDTWQEIPSPLGHSSTAQLVSLSPSQAGIIARVYDSQAPSHDAAGTLIFVNAHKQWQDASRVANTIQSASPFSSHSYLHFYISAKDDEAVCTCCGAPTTGWSLGPVDPGSFDYHSYLYKACRCYCRQQPDIETAVVAILGKLGWRVPQRFLNDESDKSTDDEGNSDESGSAT